MVIDARRGGNHFIIDYQMKSYNINNTYQNYDRRIGIRGYISFSWPNSETEG
jgi:hypothetical protein